MTKKEMASRSDSATASRARHTSLPPSDSAAPPPSLSSPAFGSSLYYWQQSEDHRLRPPFASTRTTSAQLNAEADDARMVWRARASCCSPRVCGWTGEGRRRGRGGGQKGRGGGGMGRRPSSWMQQKKNGDLITPDHLGQTTEWTTPPKDWTMMMNVVQVCMADFRNRAILPVLAWRF